MVAGSDTAGITPSALARARRAGRVLLDHLGAAKMVMLRALPERFHAITDEMAKFGTIGLINLGVNFAIFNALLIYVGDSQVKAKAIATVVATTCAYFLNRYWTYRHRPKSTLRREYSLFFFFNAVGLVIEAGIVAVAKYGFQETSLVVLNLCTFVGIGLGTIFRFWAYRTHVFKQTAVETATATTTFAANPVATVQPGVAEPHAPERQQAGLHDAEPQDAELHDSEPQDAEPQDAELEDPELEGPELEDPEHQHEGFQDEERLREEMVQLELDELLDRDLSTPESGWADLAAVPDDPANRH